MSTLESKSQSSIDRFSKMEVLSFFESDVKKQFSGFSIAHFDRIELSGKSTGEYFISFSNAINYVPQHAAYYYSIGYFFEIIGQGGKESIRINQSTMTPCSSEENLIAKDFYVHKQDNKEIVKRVMKATKISEVASTDVCFIYERQDHYEMTLVNDQVEGFWIVDKNNFTVIREGHNPLVSPHDPKNDWVKIDWK